MDEVRVIEQPTKGTNLQTRKLTKTELAHALMVVNNHEFVLFQVKQIMNKVFFKIRGEFVAGESYKGSTVINVALNVIKVCSRQRLLFHYHKTFSYTRVLKLLIEN